MASPISAILLDAGGVMIFPAHDLLAPPLRAAGFEAGADLLQRAHYRAMAAQDVAATPPVAGTWWHEYLLSYLDACGVPGDQRDQLVAEINRGVSGPTWTYVGADVMEGLRAVAGLGLPLGVVSNSDGTVAAELARLGVCYAPSAHAPGAHAPGAHAPGAHAPGAPPADAGPANGNHAGGIPVGVVLDSAVVGVAKPDPAIFGIALEALDLPADGTVVHVGDSLRYDVAGAQAAGLRPVHMDPYGFCPAPGGHQHVRSLAEVAALAAP